MTFRIVKRIESRLVFMLAKITGSCGLDSQGTRYFWLFLVLNFENVRVKDISSPFPMPQFHDHVNDSDFDLWPSVNVKANNIVQVFVFGCSTSIQVYSIHFTIIRSLHRFHQNINAITSFISNGPFYDKI